MNKKNKSDDIGGTGGHVFRCYLADHLDKNIYDTELVTDIRGMKFLNIIKILKFIHYLKEYFQYFFFSIFFIERQLDHFFDFIISP